MGNLSHSPVNDHRMADLLSEVREFGRSSAEGRDALPALSMRLASAAHDGVVTMDKDKDGKDDTAKVYDEYSKAEAKKVTHGHNLNSQRANTSKLRAIVKAAIHARENGGDFVMTLDKAAVMHKEMTKADAKSTVPPYTAYVSVARAQLDKAEDLSDDEIRTAVGRKPANDPVLEDKLERIRKSIEDVITGEKGVKDQDERVLAAHDLLKERIAALVLDRETKELDERLAKSGMRAVKIDTPESELTFPETNVPASEQLAA